MTRIRTVKPEFFRHISLFKAEKESGLPLRIAFAGLWCVADREGRFRWSPEELKLDTLPYDDVDFSRVLDALSTRGFIVHYASDGHEFGCIPSWKRHQVINNRERPSEIPQFIIGQEIIDASSTREPRDTVITKGKGNGKGNWKEEEKEASEISEADFQINPEPDELEFDAQSPESELANLLLTEHRKIDPLFLAGKDLASIKRWAPDIEKLIRIDKREHDEIERVIRWCQTPGNFWAGNILSGSKLREKFPQLLIQSQRPENRERTVEERLAAAEAIQEQMRQGATA